MSLQPLLLTLQLIAVAVVIAGIIGIVGAWAATVLQSTGRIGRFAVRCFLLAMVIGVATPLMLHAAAWEATAGKFGWWTMTQTGARTNSAGAYGSFRGLLACGWIHGAFGAAITALATWYGTAQTPDAVIEQSRMDLGPVALWWQVRLPIAAPWSIAALLATATIAATEMSVVDLYGYETVADVFYLYFAIDPSLPRILWTCTLPLALAAALLIWLFISRRRLLVVRSQRDRRELQMEPTSMVITAFCFSIVASIITIVTLVPIGGLVIKAGQLVSINDGVIDAAWSAGACWERLAMAPDLFAAEYTWTALIATVTGITSLLIAWPLAMIGRRRRGIERLLDIVTVLAFAVPGPIIGMSVVQLFQLPLPGFRFLYSQTIGPAVIALLVRAVPIGYWVLRSGYRGLDQAVLDSARLELSLWRRVRDVDLPLLGRALVLAMLACSLFASGDVPSILPVIPAGVTMVGTRLFELLHAGARYQEASLALWYVLFVVAIALVWVRQFDNSRVK